MIEKEQNPDESLNCHSDSLSEPESLNCHCDSQESIDRGEDLT